MKRHLIHKDTTIIPWSENVVTCARIVCIVFVAMFLGPAKITCQQVQYLNPNSIRAGFATGGTLFNAADTAVYPDTLSSLLSIAHGYTIPTMLSSGFWASGLDAGGNLKGAASTIYRNTDWTTSPCSDTYDATYDSLYNRVFKVTQTDIAYHIAHYQDNGYQMPASIAQWPGNGRATFHEQQNLAPYVDLNHNGIYDPQNGDYPNICGDEAIFFMLNDARNVHSEFNSAPMGVQLNVLAFDVQSGIPAADSVAINGSIFMKLGLVNCSATNYNNVLFSIFNDYRIGCYENDRAGCDTIPNSFFGYNGSYPDNGCASGNSDSNKVAESTVFLNEKLYSHAVFTAFADNQSYPWPATAATARNYQSGAWSDGTDFTIGGDGYGGNTPTHYIYPGNPLDTSDWSDMTSGTAPGRRAGIGTIKLDSLSSGETKNVDVAFVSSFLLSTDTTNEITDLKQRIASVQSYYSSFNQCGREYTGVREAETDEITYSIHPNPASDFVQLDFSLANSANVSIQITDIAGKVVDREPLGMLASGTYSHRINITGFSKGMYFCNLLCGTHTTTQKLIKIE